ncbi:MAG: sigma-70 family RNA polymerase sigma factor, partial [Candidatus Kapaibacterium sp.]
MQITDQELLSKIASQDERALSQLYDRYAKLLFGTAVSILHETDDAEDILQEVFVQVWRKASTYQPALGTVKNWLVRISHNRAINMLRSKRNREKQAEISIPDDSAIRSQEFVSDQEDSPWAGTSRAEEQAHISSALSTLPEDQRMLIDLAFFQGYSHSEIA